MENVLLQSKDDYRQEEFFEDLLEAQTHYSCIPEWVVSRIWSKAEISLILLKVVLFLALYLLLQSDSVLLSRPLNVNIKTYEAYNLYREQF